MSSVAVGDRPSPADCHEAVTRALEARLAAYRTSIPNTRMTNACLLEQVMGMPLANAERGHDGWWRVGSILDHIADHEYDVWYQPPVPPRLAVSERKGRGCCQPTPWSWQSTTMVT